MANSGADRVYANQQRIHIAIHPNIPHFQYMAALFALAPQFVPRAAEKRDFSARLRRGVRFGVHKAQHEDFARGRILNHRGNQAVEFLEIQVHRSPPTPRKRRAQNKKPADAYRASGPMSANFDALLKPPRARSYAVMVMMAVVSRGEPHCEKDYTRAIDSRQEM